MLQHEQKAYDQLHIHEKGKLLKGNAQTERTRECGKNDDDHGNNVKAELGI